MKREKTSLKKVKAPLITNGAFDKIINLHLKSGI